MTHRIISEAKLVNTQQAKRTADRLESLSRVHGADPHLQVDAHLVEDLLADILTELRLIRMHHEVITDEQFNPEDIEDEFGNFIPTLTVDQAKKDQVLAQRLEDELSDNEQKAIKETAKQAKRDALILFKDKNNKSASDIISGLESIISYLIDRDDF